MKTTKEGRRDRHVIETARIYSSSRYPRNANLGLIDFTALVCVPGVPRCGSCMLRKACCYATGQGAVAG
jgi:adenine-specific DNA glycosylase